MPRVEYIIWKDAGRLDDDQNSIWLPVEQLRAIPTTAIHSIGFLIHETPDAVVIAGHYHEGGPSAAGNLVIPKGFIQSRKRIKLPA